MSKRNRAHLGAYRKGWEAAESGLPISACPYRDKRTADNKVTFSRAFITAWGDGYQDQKKGVWRGD